MPLKKISAFLTALEQATTYLQSHPDEAWQAFANHKPKELNTELNQLAWKDTLPLLAAKPRQLDAKLSTNGGVYASKRLDSKST